MSDGTLKMMKDIIKEAKREDSVRGKWYVLKVDEGIVWCDVSSISTVVVFEVEGVRVEDAGWLRKKTGADRINVAELEVLVKGVNLALKWELRNIDVKTGSVTVLA